MKISIAIQQRGTPHTKLFEVECHTLPREGDYMSHDQLGFSGTVHRVTYWWDEKGKFRPEVRILV